MLYVSKDITFSNGSLYFGIKKVHTTEPVSNESYAVLNNKYAIYTIDEEGQGHLFTTLDVMSGGFFWLCAFGVSSRAKVAHLRSAFYKDFEDVEYILNTALDGIPWEISEDRI